MPNGSSLLDLDYLQEARLSFVESEIFSQATPIHIVYCNNFQSHPLRKRPKFDGHRLLSLHGSSKSSRKVFRGIPCVIAAFRIDIPFCGARRQRINPATSWMRSSLAFFPSVLDVRSLGSSPFVSAGVELRTVRVQEKKLLAWYSLACLWISLLPHCGWLKDSNVDIGVAIGLTLVTVAVK